MPHDLTLVAVGSVMFQSRPSMVQDPEFHGLLDVARAADAAFLNLEAPIHDPSAHAVKQYVYTSYVTSEPWLPDELVAGGFRLASIANNHMADFAPSSIDLNQRLLSDAGIAWSGAGRSLAEARAPGYLDTPKGRIALISVDSSHEYGQFMTVQMAGDPHGGVPARPGTNGLRWETVYELDAAAFDAVRAAHRALGLDHEGVEISHITPPPNRDSFEFRGVRVQRAAAARVATRCHGDDLQQITRWVRSARRQADCVLVSHHNHTAAAPDWAMPVDFVREFAHAVIDAGADAYIGHGYTPKGIEIHRGRPIFYDIGDWSTQDGAARRHPGDAYARWGLDPRATPGEFADAREAARRWVREECDNDEFRAIVDGYMRATSQSALVRFSFDDDEVSEITLFPCEPVSSAARHRKGLPRRARGSRAKEIVERFAGASESFGTKIHFDDDGEVGVVRMG